MTPDTRPAREESDVLSGADRNASRWFCSCFWSSPRLCWGSLAFALKSLFYLLVIGMIVFVAGLICVGARLGKGCPSR
jgi:hypothetical protein